MKPRRELPTPEERSACERERDHLRNHIFGSAHEFEAAARRGPCFCHGKFICTKCLLLRQAT